MSKRKNNIPDGLRLDSTNEGMMTSRLKALAMLPILRKRDEITSSNFKISETFDQFSKHEEEMVACVRGRDKIIISPILHWTERNVWEFLNEVVKVPHKQWMSEKHYQKRLFETDEDNED